MLISEDIRLTDRYQVGTTIFCFSDYIL